MGTTTNNKSHYVWEAYLKEKGKAWLKVETGSMFPMIPVSASILVRKCHFENIGRFDLVVFKSNGKFVVHRVLGKQKEYVLQAGDNHSIPGLINKDFILGKVSVIKGTNYVIDLEQRKNVLLNSIISITYIFAHKIMKNHRWFWRLTNKLLTPLLRIMRTYTCNLE